MGENSQKKQQIKLMSLLIIYVVNDLQSHICSGSPDNFTLRWVIPGKYVLKAVPSTPPCSKVIIFPSLLVLAVC